MESDKTWSWVNDLSKKTDRWRWRGVHRNQIPHQPLLWWSNWNGFSSNLSALLWILPLPIRSTHKSSQSSNSNWTCTRGWILAGFENSCTGFGNIFFVRSSFFVLLLVWTHPHFQKLYHGKIYTLSSQKVIYCVPARCTQTDAYLFDLVLVPEYRPKLYCSIFTSDFHTQLLLALLLNLQQTVTGMDGGEFKNYVQQKSNALT